MKNCSVFASLISPSKMILFEKKYQTFDTVFHHQMKHLEVRQKYSAARRIFNSLLGVSSGDKTLHLMFDILHDIVYVTISMKDCNSMSRVRGKPYRLHRHEFYELREQIHLFDAVPQEPALHMCLR